jgi:photosystem II PsbZ protein
MTVIFQLLLAFFVFFSFLMIVAVPVAYALPGNWNQTRPLLYVGSLIWAVMVIVLGVLNAFVT